MVDILIILMYIAIAIALAATIWSIYRKIRIVGKTSGKVHGIPMRAIIIVITLTLLTLLAVTYITADVTVESAGHDDSPAPFWLRISNMMVVTSVIIFSSTIATMGYSIFHSARLAGKTLLRQLFCDMFILHRKRGKTRHKRTDSTPRPDKQSAT